MVIVKFFIEVFKVKYFVCEVMVLNNYVILYSFVVKLYFDSGNYCFLLIMVY